MSQSYISLKKSAHVIIGHICSDCGFPIITVATINTEAIQYYTFSQTKAQETASQECSKAIRFEIDRINNYTYQRESIYQYKPLSFDINTVSGSHYGSYCVSSIKDITTPCPNCFNIEKWQKENGHSSGSENYPTIFNSIEAAENWSRNIIADLVREIDSKRSLPNEINVAQQTTIRLTICNKELEQQLLQMPELSQQSEIKQEKKQAESQLKNLAIFNFKGKKVLKAKIKAYNEQLKELEQIIARKEAGPRNIIQKNKLELQKVQPIAYGYTNQITIKQIRNTIVYLITPNKIPNEQVNSDKNNLIDKIITTNEIEEAPQIKFCNKCGFKLLSDSTFCSNCGGKIERNIL